jgi:hypothetical protein
VAVHVLLQHLPPGRTHSVQERVAHDREEPGAAISPRVEPLEAAKRAQERVLDDVIRLRAIPGQSERCLVQPVQVDERHLLELAQPFRRSAEVREPHLIDANPRVGRPIPRGTVCATGSQNRDQHSLIQASTNGGGDAPMSQRWTAAGPSGT